MIRIAQITDCHLQNDPQQLYRDIDVEQRLSRVVDDLLATELLPDFILWTGDLIHHGAADGYQRLNQRLLQLPVPSYWIPGNHDDAELMQQTGGALNQRVIVAGDWAVILLDSTSQPDGRGSGSLATPELEFLTTQLQRYPDKHCLIVLHHNPVATGSVWQDQIMLANAEQFWDVLSDFSHVRGVLCGHVHQAWDKLFQGVRVLMTPASSVQFKPHCEHFQLEENEQLSGPAYRTLNLTDRGEITTSVKRISTGSCKV